MTPQQPVSSLMERQVIAIEMDDTVADIQNLFTRKGLTWAPVLDEQRAIVGVVSASDLLHFHGEWQDPATVKAWQLCTYKPIIVPHDMPVAEVARLMVESRVHHVVVTDAQGIAGVVSSMDFVRTFVGR
ncbi:MAG: CBS domain-containing protein [Pseudomonadota bacterium]